MVCVAAGRASGLHGQLHGVQGLPHAAAQLAAAAWGQLRMRLAALLLGGAAPAAWRLCCTGGLCQQNNSTEAPCSRPPHLLRRLARKLPAAPQLGHAACAYTRVWWQGGSSIMQPSPAPLAATAAARAPPWRTPLTGCRGCGLIDAVAGL